MIELSGEIELKYMKTYNGLIDWLIDCLIDWLIDWLTNWCAELSGETELKYTIKLTKFERSKESWQLDADQKVEQVYYWW